MSFSKDVKKELSKINNLSNKNEITYEFLGYIASNNIEVEKNYIRFSTENDYNINRFAKIIRNIGIEDFNININGKSFFIDIKKSLVEGISKFDFKSESIDNLRLFIRGLFMGSGSINNPENTYHLEFTIRIKEDAINIIEIMNKYGLKLKQIENLIYIKEGEEISKFLAFIGANKSVLKFEEIRVQKHMNNKVNRLVNCKTANLNKVLNASIEQVQAIKKLKELGSFERLEEGLKEIANLRIEYPDISLSELGQKLSNPLGKSGVNYRLKKIIKIAEEEE